MILFTQTYPSVCAFNCHSVAAKCRNIIVKMMLPTGQCQCVAVTVLREGDNNNKIGPEHITNIYTARRTEHAPYYPDTFQFLLIKV